MLAAGPALATAPRLLEEGKEDTSDRMPSRLGTAQKVAPVVSAKTIWTYLGIGSVLKPICQQLTTDIHE